MNQNNYSSNWQKLLGFRNMQEKLQKSFYTDSWRVAKKPHTKRHSQMTSKITVAGIKADSNIKFLLQLSIARGYKAIKKKLMPMIA